MIRHSKWLPHDVAEAPLTEVARMALAARLAAVWHHFPPAALDGEHDAEHVHQLRVATRRATAALRLFDDLLPEGRVRRFQQQLQKIRRAAGKARDLDVLAPRLAGPLDSDDGGWAAASLKRRLHALRHAAQGPLAELHRELTRKSIEREIGNLLRRVCWRHRRPEPSFQEAAGRLLRKASKKFFAAAETDGTDLTDLHVLRIRGKRLRYVIEMLSGAFPPNLREDLYHVVVDVQQRLGEINDHATACDHLRDWLDQTGDQREAALLRGLIDKETAQLTQSHGQFMAWWTAARRQDLVERFHRL
jgi:CHAD domain-containing protein